MMVQTVGELRKLLFGFGDEVEICIGEDNGERYAEYRIETVCAQPVPPVPGRPEFYCVIVKDPFQIYSETADE